MRLKYYDKHDTEIQVGMLLRHAKIAAPAPSARDLSTTFTH